MHMAYSKTCLAYGYWNKGKKPWDKCLTLANKEWQVRERRERQTQSQVSDRNPGRDRPCDRPRRDCSRERRDCSRERRDRSSERRRERETKKSPARGHSARHDNSARRDNSRHRRSEPARPAENRPKEKAPTFRLSEKSPAAVSLTERPTKTTQEQQSRRPAGNRPKQEGKNLVTKKDEKAKAKKSDKEPAEPATTAQELDSSSSYYSSSYYESPEVGPEPKPAPTEVKAVPPKVALQAAKPKKAPAAPSSSSAGPHNSANMNLVGAVLSSQAEMMQFWMNQQRQAGQG